MESDLTAVRLSLQDTLAASARAKEMLEAKFESADAAAAVAEDRADKLSGANATLSSEIDILKFV